MTDVEKNVVPGTAVSEPRSSDLVRETVTQRLVKPRGWKYRSFRIGSFKFPWFASPLSQLLIVSFVCFL